MKKLRSVFALAQVKGGLFVRYLLLGIGAGLTSFLFVTLVNQMINLLLLDQMQDIRVEYIALFVVVVLMFIWARRSLSEAVINLSQRLFWNLRKEVLRMILSASHEQLKDRKERVHAVLVRDVGTLTGASLSIIDFVTNVVVSIACFSYMAYISPMLFCVTIGIVLIGILTYHFAVKRNNPLFDRARDLEDDFMHDFNAILEGFKEIHMSPAKGKDIFKKRIVPISEDSFTYNRRAFIGFLNNQIIGQILFYLLIAAVLLIFSVTLGLDPITTVNFLFVLLFVISSIETVMVLMPILVQAKVSSDRLFALKEELEKMELKNEEPQHIIKLGELENISVNDLQFTYDSEDEKAFSVGPVSMEINTGEITFIRGGNGSGKTTMMQMILGLLKVESGSISFNGIPLTEDNYSDYRNLFAVVFSDFYLFDELFGIEEVNESEVQRYLDLFEIGHKVDFENGRFSTRSLSTGQRKRLALVACLLEDKPVIVLDEWAADQDPYFREKFYTSILPQLRDEGYTILAITHDDKYYHCADHLFAMDYGKLRKIVAERNEILQEEEVK
jgi:putative ATP-binding cassette transporter